MQSEAGPPGTLHGASLKGALATTFTSSQGLLLMLPNLFKVGGRTVTGRGPRGCPGRGHPRPVDLRRPQRRHGGAHDRDGDAVLVVGPGGPRLRGAWPTPPPSRSRVPFLHFFDGFRTSHEMNRVDLLDDDDLLALVGRRTSSTTASGAWTRTGRCCGAAPRTPTSSSRPGRPPTRSTPPYPASSRRSSPNWPTAPVVAYGLIEYQGHPEAERALVIMGSGAGAAGEAVDAMVADGEKVGLLDRPPVPPVPHGRPDRGAARRRCVASPCWTGPRSRARSVSRSTSTSWPPWSRPRPLVPGRCPTVIGARYGLGSKEFTPADVKGLLRRAGPGHPPSPRHRRDRRRRDRTQRRAGRRRSRPDGHRPGGVPRPRQRRHRRCHEGHGEDPR